MIFAVIDTYLQRHEQFLEQSLNQVQIPADSMRRALHYTLFPGGKRIRPLLVYLAGELLNVALPILDVIAASIELTHCYSLVHDDLPAMDNDDLRRGKPSCHKAFDEATAILAGDGLQALAIELLVTRLPPLLEASQVVMITKELVHASGVSGMVSGQSLDLSELAQSTVDEKRLKAIHLLKTGKLISACCDMVLLAQPQEEQYANALRTYAQHLGLVFQMQDDYLDHYGPAYLLGKGRSSDAANQKTTFATLFAQDQLEKAIATHYHRALESLAVFGAKAKTLNGLTKQLEQRSQLI